MLTLIIANKRYSSWSFRPWLAMKAAAIPFKEIQVFLGKKDSAKRIGKYSPGGRVPVLIDGKIRIWESLAILEYLAEKYPSKPLWPKAPAARAMARAVSNEMHAGFQALRSNLPCHFVSRWKDFEVPSEAQTDIDRVREIWTECRQRFGKRGPFLFGTFSIADAMYAPVVFRFLAYGVKMDPLSRQYMKTIESMPAAREWVRAAAEEKERIPAYENF